MMKYFVFLIISLFFSCNREFKGDGNNSRHRLTVDGERRTYRLYLPESYNQNKSYPLLIAMHGRYGNSKNMAKSTLFSPLADEYEVIVEDSIRCIVGRKYDLLAILRLTQHKS